MKAIIALCASILLVAPLSDTAAQSRRDEPTVRYEGRPVEDIVRNGVPVTNPDRNTRVIVTEQDKALQRRQWQERQREQDARWRRERQERYERRGWWLRDDGTSGYYAAYPPLLDRYTWTTREPWRYNLPDRGPRYIWAKIGWDAVLYDVNTRYPVYIWNNWFR